MKTDLRHYPILNRILFTMFLLTFPFMPSVAGNSGTQETPDIRITGVIVGNDGNPVIGAGIIVVDSTIGTVSDLDGKFELYVPENTKKLQVSSIGYQTQIVDIATKTNLKIVLIEDALSLQETVVIGYGTQKKVNLTSAVSSIDNKEITNTVGTGVVSKIQGKIPGVNIRQMSGEPGSFDNSVNIRGLGEPLYVIDGINRPAHDFQRLNADDIESISVLKDASAAIYGLNAANGVIIVTTKKGTTGKTKFKFSANVGLSHPTNTVEMADAYEYYTLANDAQVNIGNKPIISSEELELWRIGAEGHESTDWYKETFKPLAVRQEYNLSAEGGTEKVSYYVNLNYTDDGSILKTNDIDYNKIGIRTNLSANLTKTLKAQMYINAYSDKRTRPSYEFREIWRGTVSSLPYHKPYLDDNRQFIARVQDGQSYNPVAISSSDRVGYINNEYQSFQTNFELSWKPEFAKGLEFKGVIAYDFRFSNSKTLYKTYQMYDYDKDTDEYVANNYWDPAFIRRSFDKSQFITTQLMADYHKTFNSDHNLGATVVFETRQSDFDYLTVSPKYFDFLTNDEISYASEKDQKSAGTRTQTRNMSFLGRLNYNYKGKYLIELSARYDGSYRYHPKMRWGLFPVVSAGWRISEEKFMKNVDFISNLKLRASYGIVGQDTGNPFQYITAFTVSGGGWAEFSDGKITTGVASPNLTNENLTWMRNYMSNIGVDLGFFDGKLSLTADIFQRDRTGILARRNVLLPNTFGATFPEENLNSNRTRGLELSVIHQNNIGEFFYSVNANFTYARTMDMHVEGPEFLDSFSNYKGNTNGRWSGLVWGYNVIGQFESFEQIANAPIQGGAYGNNYVMPGDWIYEDINGDGVIDGDDLVPIGTSVSPIYNYGLTLDIGWKGFDLSVLFQGAAGFSAQYSHAYTMMFAQDGNIPAYFMDRYHIKDQYDPYSEWVPGKWPAIRTDEYVGQLYSSNTAWRRDCSYLRIKNVEFGYTFKQNFIHKIGLDSVRLYFNATNLVTFCDEFIKAFDPEKTSNLNGWDYPLMRTYNFGVDINF